MFAPWRPRRHGCIYPSLWKQLLANSRFPSQLTELSADGCS